MVTVSPKVLIPCSFIGDNVWLTFKIRLTVSVDYTIYTMSYFKIRMGADIIFALNLGFLGLISEAGVSLLLETFWSRFP